MEKLENRTLYRCEKCGETFEIEDCCKAHEDNCDGERRGKLAAEELNDLIRDIRRERGIKIFAPNDDGVIEAYYNAEKKRIELVSF